jgi:hypothetical protein
LLNSFHGHWTNRGVEPFGTDGCGWNSGDLGYNIVPHLRPDETTCSCCDTQVDTDSGVLLCNSRTKTGAQWFAGSSAWDYQTMRRCGWPPLERVTGAHGAAADCGVCVE